VALTDIDNRGVNRNSSPAPFHHSPRTDPTDRDLRAFNQHGVVRMLMR
jgi:hypothetical protein